jgi:hypothetical protein
MMFLNSKAISFASWGAKARIRSTWEAGRKPERAIIPADPSDECRQPADRELLYLHKRSTCSGQRIGRGCSILVEPCRLGTLAFIPQAGSDSARYRCAWSRRAVPHDPKRHPKEYNQVNRMAGFAACRAARPSHGSGGAGLVSAWDV